MRLYFYIISAIVASVLLISSFSSADDTTTTVIVVEGRVICFDIPKELADKELIVGRFVKREDEETSRVELEEEIVRAYIPQEYRDQIGERLKPGVYVLCVRIIRRLKLTVCDIVAVGTEVKTGSEYSEGIINQSDIDLGISQTIPIQSINKAEQSIASGEGEGAQAQLNITENIPQIEGEEEEAGAAAKQYYWVNPTGNEYQIGDYIIAANGQDIAGNDGSNEEPWRTIGYALTRVTGSDIQLVPTTYSTTYSDGPGEQFPLRMTNSNVNIVGQGAGSSIISGTGDTANGGLIVWSGPANVTTTIRNVTIQNGVGVGSGGGLSITNATVTLSNCTISSNGASTTDSGGGGIRASDSTITLSNCTISSNTSTNMGGGTGGRGGGMWTGSCTVNISDCTFSQNSGNGANGGGLDWSGSTGTGTLTITRSTFNDNNNVTQTTNGGAIALRYTGQTATITRTNIYNNEASSAGGGIYIDGANASIVNCRIVNNTSAGAAEGGGININSTTTTDILNCTLYGNSRNGIGVHSVEGPSSSNNIRNNIINNSTRYGIYESVLGDDPMTVNNNCIRGNSLGIATWDTIAYPDTQAGMNNFNTAAGATENNIWKLSGDIFKGEAAADFRLKAGITSPSGDDEVRDGCTVSSTSDDLLGTNVRPYNGANDMGCYEYQGSDPPITGRVYDSVTGETISSPTVSIYNANTNAQVGVTTSNPFTFNVDPGSYYLAVSKDGYAFPSQIVSSTTSGDHGDIFTASADPLTINIPMDPDGWLVVEKTCNKERVEIGDIVTYQIKVQNKHWYKSVENVELVDELVNGFKYVNTPNFNLGTVSANSTQTITYQVRVGSAVPPGRYKAAAYTRKTTTLARNSNISSTGIEVVENPLFTRGTIIGKVFWDFNGNGVQDKGDSGVGGFKIYTEYGVVVETDMDGKYHIANVPAGNHLLKLDTTQLPEWVSVTTDNPYYVKITEGLLAKVNFGLKAEEKPVRPRPSRGAPNQKPENQFFIIALGEGIVRNLDTSGNIDMVEKDDRYDDGVSVDGRLALYLKGKILGKYLIKASIDTERRPKGRYDTRKLFTNLDPDKYYPVYGDASKVDYSGVDTQDIVYVIVEWDESLAKWGSFHTELPLYNRSLSGGIINYHSVGKTNFGDTKTKIKGFGAYSRQKPAHDEFIGTGGSLYYLRHRDIIEGSEKVRVEVRDRVGKITVNSIPLVEEKDYEIDYDTGRILLRRPLNSIQQDYNNSIISNDILMGERVYLVVDYEYYSEGLSEQAWGVNASQWLGDHIRVGGTYVEEQSATAEGDPYKLMAGDGTVRINKDTEVNVNYSRTEETQLGSTMSYDGGLTFTEQGSSYSLGKSGSAVSVDGKTKLFNNTDIFLCYSRQDPYYSITNSISSQGSQKYLGSAVTKITENLSVGVTHLTQKYYEGSVAGDTFGATDSHTTTGVLDWRPGKWDIRGEYQHQEVKSPITDYTYFGTLPLLENDFIAARVGYQLFSWLHPYIRGQVTVNGDANDQGTAGADINIGRNTTINLAETVGTLGDSTLVGLTTKVTEETDAYANLEVGNHTQLGKYTRSTYGQSTQLSWDSRAYIEEDYSSYRENVIRGNVLGYKKKITDTLALGLTYERSNVKHNTTAIDRDAGAISVSYLNPDWLKAASKLEIRNDRGLTEVRQWVNQNDILWYPAPWLSLSGRGNWGWTSDLDNDTDEAEFYEAGAGFSLRPVTWDKLNILGKYSYTADQPPDAKWDFPLDIDSIKHVYSIEGIYDLFRYLSLIGKFSYRDMSEKVGTFDWVDSDTYLYIARTNFHIMNSESDKPFLLRGWDFAVEYRMLANTEIEDEKEGWLVELDKDLGSYVRCGVGYNFTDYDDDLRNDDNWDAEGWFFKLAGKY